MTKTLLQRLKMLFILFAGFSTLTFAQPTITSFLPASGTLIGTLVTVVGTNLSSPTVFTIGGTTAIVVSNNGTTLVGLVMPGATTGNISISTGGGSTTSSGNFTVTPSLLPIVQEGSKLVGTGATGSTYQGYSISLSSDGNTAIVGGPQDQGSVGAAWIYIRSAGVWTQQGSKLVGTGSYNANQGFSVALSADGNTAIVGGYRDYFDVGAAWVYTRSAGVWSQQGSKLIGTGAVGSAQQGWSVALSADGNTAIVGGLYNQSGLGAAWVFTRSAGVWTQEGSKLVGTGGNGLSRMGNAVSLSSDGNTAIVGGYRDNADAGAAWVFIRSAGTWTQEGSKLVGTGGTSTAGQGYSVSLSSDGNTALVGGYFDNNQAGAAWVYSRSAGVWTQEGSKLVGTGASNNAHQGTSVALSSDGNTAIIGGIYDNSSAGAAWVYTRSAGVWTQQGSKLVGTGAGNSAYQGSSVSLSSDGNTAIVGGYGDNGYGGAMWAFTRSAGVWTQQGSKLAGTGDVGKAYQGRSVSISSDGNTAIVGGIYDNGGRGATWVYTRSAGVWTQQGSKLVGTGVNAEGTFQGSSVSISSDGNTAIVGGYGENNNEGAAWIFIRSSGVWSQQGSKLVGTGASSLAHQGTSVSISSDGNTAIVGGSYDNSSVGAAWVFTRSSGVWSQQGSKLTGTGVVGAARFGNSISLSSDGNTAIIGGSEDQVAIGAAWIFVRSAGVWTQEGSKLIGTEGAAVFAYQGTSVSISSDGNTAIVGGPSYNSSAGAAWVYTRSAGVWTQQGSPLTGAEAISFTYIGSSVSLSSDGNTAFLGGSSDNGNKGSAWVFTRSAGLWTQRGSKLVGTGAVLSAQQGYSVSLSSDGSTAIAGGYADNSNAGAVWVYAPLPAPLATAATNILTTTCTANWNSSAGATGYYLDVSSNAGFTTYVNNGGTGNEDVGAVLTKSVTGLNPSTTYYYRVKAYNGIGTSANSIVITLTTSTITRISNLQQRAVILYPNPAIGQITISGLASVSNDKSISLLISDNSGKTTMQKTFERITDSETIDIGSLSDGVYFIIIQTDNGKIVKRFVKQ